MMLRILLIASHLPAAAGLMIPQSQLWRASSFPQNSTSTSVHLLQRTSNSPLNSPSLPDLSLHGHSFDQTKQNNPDLKTRLLYGYVKDNVVSKDSLQIKRSLKQKGCDACTEKMMLCSNQENKKKCTNQCKKVGKNIIGRKKCPSMCKTAIKSSGGLVEKAWTACEKASYCKKADLTDLSLQFFDPACNHEVKPSSHHCVAASSRLCSYALGFEATGYILNADNLHADVACWKASWHEYVSILEIPKKKKKRPRCKTLDKDLLPECFAFDEYCKSHQGDNSMSLVEDVNEVDKTFLVHCFIPAWSGFVKPKKRKTIQEWCVTEKKGNTLVVMTGSKNVACLDAIQLRIQYTENTSTKKTNICQSMNRSDALFYRLVMEESQSDGPILEPSTPQGFAFNWLLDTDPATVDPCTYPTLLQRYVLAVLYSATNGASWTTTTDWLTEKQECDWNGLMCDEFGKITNLDLKENTLIGNIPEEIMMLSTLKWLDLTQNQLSGTIPSQIGNLTSLEYLILAQNQLSGTFPSQIGNLSSLLYLELIDNQLSGTIPSQIGNLASLMQLYLIGNQLNGTIPSQIGNLASLQYLYIWEYLLSGTIPSQIGNITSLKSLSLEKNQLSGTIPSQIGNLASLLHLYLKNNTLSGTIPSQIGNLARLYCIYLNGNQLSGTIPSQIGNITSLESLDLSYNQLSGTIFSQIGNLASLSRAHFHENDFWGTMPTQIKNIPELYKLTADCEEVECSSCTTCY